MVVTRLDERVSTGISRDRYCMLFCWRCALYVFLWTGEVFCAFFCLGFAYQCV